MATQMKQIYFAALRGCTTSGSVLLPWRGCTTSGSVIARAVTSDMFTSFRLQAAAAAAAQEQGSGATAVED